MTAQRRFFNSGATRSYDFRVRQLRALRAALARHEAALLAALAADLGKPDVEAFASEIGVVGDEIGCLLDGLAEWMRPERRPTPVKLWPARSEVAAEPLGVVLIIAPWNYPVQLLLLPLAGAIAAGNCAVLKPSEEVPATAAALEKLIAETFPPEYVAVVQGDGARVVPELLGGPRLDHVFFTGSTNVGRKIMAMAAAQLIPVTLELGGKSPAIVFDGANVETAARRIVWGKCYNAGQSCVAPDYALVPEGRVEEFLACGRRAVEGFYGADPLASPDLARIVNARRFGRLRELLGQGRVRSGGRADEASRRMEPALLDQVELGSGLMTEEIFGPLLPVIAYRREEEVGEIVARNPHPLAAYFFGNAGDWPRRLAFGGGCVNDTLIHFANGAVPFGGVGASGIGRYHGRESFAVFSHRKALLTAPARFDLPFRYPPYRPWQSKLFRWFFR